MIFMVRMSLLITFLDPLFYLPGSSPQAEMDSCVSYLRFPVTHAMAPLSRLLVYYVRENGEGVTDSLQIPVQPRFENQVCLHWQN